MRIVCDLQYVAECSNLLDVKSADKQDFVDTNITGTLNLLEAAARDEGRDLGREHQVRAVAHHRDHLGVGPRHLDAERAGDLVAHARVAVLDVVALAVARAPHL